MNIDPYKRELLYRKAHGNSLRESYKKSLNLFSVLTRKKDIF